MSGISAMWYAMKLQKAGKDHLAFLQSVAEEAGRQKGPKAQYGYAKTMLDVHVDQCSGCTAGIIEELKERVKP